MKTTIHARDEYRMPRTVVHEDEALNTIARMAADFVARWGMVAGEPDGEDSAGRARLKLSSVENVLARAFSFAEGVYTIARERGHIIEMPSYEQIEAEAEAHRKRN